MNTVTNVFVIIRILIGAIFVVSGFEKLIGPYQNFLYVVQGYECLTPQAEEAVARIFPWIELLLGVFLMLGFWMKWVLSGIMVIISSFIVVVGQAILRDLPIKECGCFGALISLPLPAIIIFDSMLLILTGLLIKMKVYASKFSFDEYFDG